MSSWKLKSFGVVLAMALPNAACALEQSQLIGHSPSPEEIAVLDIDVRPDGFGLPDGRGSVSDGEGLYDAMCAACHGTFGEGEGRYPALAGGRGTLGNDRPIKTVGSYWPYAAPLFDYTYRTMPFGNAQSLSADETYAILAYVLYLNDLVDEDAVMDQNSLAAITMPNVDGFVMADNRPDTPQERCMTNCPASVRVHSRARDLNVTPDEGANPE